MPAGQGPPHVVAGGPAPAVPRGLERGIPGHPRLLKPNGALPRIPGYEVVRELDRGGMGLVVEAKRLSDARTVAIKVVRPDLPPTKERKSRFKREIRMTRELDHPHIIEFIEGDEFSGLLWFAMEYIEDGYDIAKHIKRHRGRIPMQEAVKLVLQALDALDYAYRDKGVVHRDIKPPNVFLVKREDGYTVKVSDFGLAKSLESSGLNGSVFTQPGLCMGTLPYMPPEQVIDVRSAKPSADVFSIGATLYQMLTGRYIRDFRFDHRRHQSEAIRQVVDEPVIPIRSRDRSVPARLAAIIDKSLELDPRDRYTDAREFKAALRGAVP
ncbi:MAG: serine/threonine-protein kinase [Dehalococcoidia bacterium]